jgi:hypothetical protein
VPDDAPGEDDDVLDRLLVAERVERIRRGLTLIAGGGKFVAPAAPDGLKEPKMTVVADAILQVLWQFQDPYITETAERFLAPHWVGEYAWLPPYRGIDLPDWPLIPACGGVWDRCTPGLLYAGMCEMMGRQEGFDEDWRALRALGRVEYVPPDKIVAYDWNESPAAKWMRESDFCVLDGAWRITPTWVCRLAADALRWIDERLVPEKGKLTLPASALRGLSSSLAEILFEIALSSWLLPNDVRDGAAMILEALGKDAEQWANECSVWIHHLYGKLSGPLHPRFLPLNVDAIIAHEPDRHVTATAPTSADSEVPVRLPTPAAAEPPDIRDTSGRNASPVIGTGSETGTGGGRRRGPQNREGGYVPADPVPISWLRSVLTQKKVKGDASKVALWLKRPGRNVRVFKIAHRNYAERVDLLKVFKSGSRVHELISEYVDGSD